MGVQGKQGVQGPRALLGTRAFCDIHFFNYRKQSALSLHNLP